MEDNMVKPTRSRPRRKRSQSLTNINRGGRRAGRRRAPEPQEAPKVAPKTVRRFFFEDDYSGIPVRKLDATTVEEDVTNLQRKIDELQRQLQETEELEQKQLQEEKTRCKKTKKMFYKKAHKRSSVKQPTNDLTESVLETKSLIGSMQTENATLRNGNKKLREDLFDLHQKTVQLEQLTESTLNWVQELEEKHLPHERAKNLALHDNLKLCRDGEEQFQVHL